MEMQTLEEFSLIFDFVRGCDFNVNTVIYVY